MAYIILNKRIPARWCSWYLAKYFSNFWNIEIISNGKSSKEFYAAARELMENVSKASAGKTVYTCPTCGERMERDLLLFMRHTDAHIVEEIKRLHPEWVTQDGFCPDCLNHFKSAMHGEVIVANIAGHEVKKRQLFMIFTLGLGITAFLALSLTGAPRFWRLFLFLPFCAAIISCFQVKKNHCVVLGMKGARNRGHGEETLTDPVEKTRLRRESQRIISFSLIFSALLTTVCFYLF